MLCITTERHLHGLFSQTMPQLATPGCCWPSVHFFAAAVKRCRGQQVGVYSYSIPPPFRSTLPPVRLGLPSVSSTCCEGTWLAFWPSACSNKCRRIPIIPTSITKMACVWRWLLLTSIAMCFFLTTTKKIRSQIPVLLFLTIQTRLSLSMRWPRFTSFLSAVVPQLSAILLQSCFIFPQN